MAPDTQLAQRVFELRRDFDAVFAAPPAVHADAESFLGIGIAGEPWALRMADIAALQRLRSVTALPGVAAGMLGLGSFRGTVVPVYDLRALLGRATAGVPRWLVLTAAPRQVGLAFDTFDGYLQQERATSRPAGTTLRFGEQVRALVELGPLLESIENRAQRSAEGE